MTKKKEQKPKTMLDDIILPQVRLGTQNTSATLNNSLIGVEVTLNQKRETFFRVGPISLGPTDYSDVIPAGLSDEEYKILSDALVDGTLVRGNHLIPPVDKEQKVLDDYVKAMDKTIQGNLTPEARQKFMNLYRKGSDSGWAHHEILTYCISKEKATKKRIDVIKLLTELADNCMGPKVLYTPPTQINEKSANKIPAMSAEAAMLLNELLKPR